LGLFPEINFFGIPSKVQCLCGFTGFGADVTSQYVDTVGRNKKQIAEYIRNQLQEDEMTDQMSIQEYIDPFTGSKTK